jgi:hypothetical protein
MGTGKTSQRSKANAAKKKYKKAKWTSNRAKDIDQIQASATHAHVFDGEERGRGRGRGC